MTSAPQHAPRDQSHGFWRSLLLQVMVCVLVILAWANGAAAGRMLGHELVLGSSLCATMGEAMPADAETPFSDDMRHCKALCDLVHAGHDMLPLTDQPMPQPRALATALVVPLPPGLTINRPDYLRPAARASPHLVL